MSQKQFQRVKVIENAAGGRLSVRHTKYLLPSLSESTHVFLSGRGIRAVRWVSWGLASRAEVLTQGSSRGRGGPETPMERCAGICTAPNNFPGSTAVIRA
jgi:hypothetical protein